MKIKIACAVFCLAFLFAYAENSSAQMPDKELASLGDPIWQEYTVALLVSLFPENESSIRKMEIVVSPCDGVQAYSWVWRDPKKILVCSGLIQFIDNEDEYAAVLAHEFGHIGLKQAPSYNLVRSDPSHHQNISLIFGGMSRAGVYPDDYYGLHRPNDPLGSRLELEGYSQDFMTFKWEPDFKAMEKQEPEADLFAIAALARSNRNPCALLRFLKRIAAMDGWEDESNEYGSVGKKRINVISKAVCLCHDLFDPD